MALINFGIKFRPRNIVNIFQKNEQTWVRSTDQYLRDMQKAAEKVIKRNAPGPGSSIYPRTGNLRRGIISEKIKVTKTGTIDRRASISVVSVAPYTKFVISGAKPSTGDGKKSGSGKFIPVNGGFRIKYGFWPGFKGNDFFAKSQQELLKINSQFTNILFNTMKASNRRAGI